MKNRIDLFCDLLKNLRNVSNENELAVCAVRDSIKKSNGTIKKAILGSKVKSNFNKAH
jgi:hypothetical protein